MPLFDYQSTTTQGQTPGTLNTAGFYNQPNVPRNSQASGIQGTDGRAYTGNVQGNELVENRLGTLLNRGDSAYLQNARQRGLQSAQRRGMGNSSISAGASERSAIEAGLPIAQADAQTYLQTRMQNQNDLNANLMQERQISNSMLEAGLNRDAAYANASEGRADAAADRDLRLRMQREGLAFEGEQQGLTRQQQEMMSRLGFSQQLGLNEQNFGYDLGRMSSDYGFRDQMANNDAFRQDWMNSEQFSRDLYGNFALNMQNAQLRNSSDFYSQLMSGLMNDPQVFGNPEYLSGVTNFFRDEIFGNDFEQFLAQLYGGGG